MPLLPEAWRKMIHEKKPEAKNLVTLSLKVFKNEHNAKIVMLFASCRHLHPDPVTKTAYL
jgi:hypothetical protein